LPRLTSSASEALGPSLFCHATPESDGALITKATPDDAHAKVLTNVEQQMVVCGHTHMQFDRKTATHRVVNPGSVGMPYEHEPGAYWALLGPDVRLQRTSYDTAAAVETIRASGFPYERLAQLLVNPPRQEVLASFEKERRRIAARASPVQHEGTS
jgi:diadenosine tetraphosphatase ApaH/serine/threonine PP2A family protein phosphatase